MASYNNRKSLVGFVVVAVVLAGLLFGGIYISKKNTSLIADNGRGRSTLEAGDNGNKTADPTADKKQEETTKQPTDTQRPDTGDADTDSSGTTKKNESTSTDKDGSSGKAVDESDLPQTGPAEDLVSIFGLGAVTASVVTYHRSRRNRLGAF